MITKEKFEEEFWKILKKYPKIYEKCMVPIRWDSEKTLPDIDEELLLNLPLDDRKRIQSLLHKL